MVSRCTDIHSFLYRFGLICSFAVVSWKNSQIFFILFIFFFTFVLFLFRKKDTGRPDTTSFSTSYDFP